MRLTQTQERAILRLRQLVNFEHARITFTPEQVDSINKKMQVNGGLFATHEEEILEATRLYRNTWINSLIDALLCLEDGSYEANQARETIKEAAKDLR